MHCVTIVQKNSYFDSVTLMSIGSEIKGQGRVEQAVVAMATELNKEMLENVGLATEEVRAAGSNDFIIAVMAETEEECEQAVASVREKLNRKNDASKQEQVEEYRTVRQVAAKGMGDIAVISVPGRYAAREAMLALRQGLHVMMFSDNVPVEDELRLKKYAAARGLLVMGPDCGTAALNGVGLCFSNSVRRGSIGLVAASGTGLQEVMVQIDRMGGGVSQAVGTGGRDLSEAVGGIMMLEGIKALDTDGDTKVIVLVSKPPAKTVMLKILDLLETVDCPVVACFLEGDTGLAVAPHIHLCDNLYDTAVLAVALANGNVASREDFGEPDAWANAMASRVEGRFLPDQKFARGFFCGGTLCAESVSILRSRLGSLKSNVSHRPGEEMHGSDGCVGNVLLDMGDDEFTNGRPHPMIEPSLRNDKIVEQAHDPSVGVILLDFELGFGSHEDPVGKTISAIREARAVAAAQGRELLFIGYVCGTASDKQDLAAQCALLEQEGVLVADSNKAASLLAAEVL